MRRNPLYCYLTSLSAALLVVSCSALGPVEIQYGQDQCDYCKMTIADKRFGSELVTDKGKVFKFDSIECLAAFHSSGHTGTEGATSLWVTNFTQPGVFLRVDHAVIIATMREKSPMGVGLVAVGTTEQARQTIQTVGGNVLTWEEVQRMVANKWHL